MSAAFVLESENSGMWPTRKFSSHMTTPLASSNVYIVEMPSVMTIAMIPTFMIRSGMASRERPDMMSQPLMRK